MGERSLAVIFISGLLIAAVIFIAKPHERWFKPKEIVRRPVEFEIKRGETFMDVAMELKANQLIEDVDDFVALGREKSVESRVQVGDYLLYTGDEPAFILKTLMEGQTQKKVTLPEGYNISQAAYIFERAGICTEDEFMAAAKAPDIIAMIDPGAKTLEGYLFPATYRYTKSDTATKIIKAMVERFKKAYTAEMEAKANELNITMREVVTLASIVEKETSRPEERPIIARVFLNRLKKQMRLESDPTVIYGIKGFDGNIRKDDLKRKGPYNTYVIKGLPPGPIGNPGVEALKAVLWPAEGQWLYFVSKNDGSHAFSTTYRDHVNAVNKYQRRR